MSSAISFYFDQTKILLFGNGLNSLIWTLFSREKEQHERHMRQMEDEMEIQMQRVEERVRKRVSELFIFIIYLAVKSWNFPV